MLKVLMTKKKLDLRRKEREELRQKEKEIQKREEELEQAVEEVSTEEEQKAVEESVEELTKEKEELQASVDELDKVIEELEGELEELEAAQETAVEEAAGETGTGAEESEEERARGGRTKREAKKTMSKRTIFTGTMDRRAMFERQDVKDFAQRLRQMGKEKRSVSNGELLIPEVMLPLLKEQVEQNAKLLKYVNLQSVRGTARERIMGTIPEAVWTEMCANLNELTLAFNDVEVDGFKVGGYIPVCNALLEDNDINLVDQILFALARAIAIAVDKAILYGKGTKMPLGIVTRLAQTAKPSDYSSTGREWADLHTTNIQKITAANSTGIKLFQSILDIFGNAKSKYGTAGKFWAMNEKTHMKLVSEAMNFNSAGAIVAGIDGTMPVIGGNIEELDFIPDDNIIAGYGELYLLAERAGVSLASSEHFLFTADKTVFKGTARYDGIPVIAEGFVVIGVNNTTPTTSLDFTEDTANKDTATTGG